MFTPRVHYWILAGIICAAGFLCLWGIKKDLPYTAEPDEGIFVTRAVNLAGLVNINPFWVGNPGPTTYPLAVAYRVWNAMSYGGNLVLPDTSIQASFGTRPGEFYLVGRILSSLCWAASIFLIFKIGKAVFDERTALLGAWFSFLSPLTLEHAQVVRTDTAELCFGLLAILLCLKLLDHHEAKYHILAGVAIGLSVATRFTLISLLCIFAAVDLAIIGTAGSGSVKQRLLNMLLGFLAVAVAFAVAAPYFFLDFQTALADLQQTVRSSHPGADALTPWGNLVWYITEALPASLTWPLTALTVIGVVLLIMRHEIKPILLVAFVLIYLVVISIHPLHWQRWLIQVLPLLSLFGAYTLTTYTEKLKQVFAGRQATSTVAIAVLVGAISVGPLYQAIMLSVRNSQPSTRILAREWVLQNIPSGSKIAQEAYTAPLDGTGYTLFQQFTLAGGRTLDDYIKAGYQYLIVSSAMYGRYFAQTERYRGFVVFYQTLFNSHALVKEFEPSFTQRGPVIRVYALTQSEKK